MFWKEVSYKKVEVYKEVECKWVFKYKTDKNRNWQKYKARLVICNNQQQNYDFSTRATTLAITFLYILLAIAVKFDLKTLQIDIVNPFVYANLDIIVFIKMPLR